MTEQKLRAGFSSRMGAALAVGLVGSLFVACASGTPEQTEPVVTAAPDPVVTAQPTADVEPTTQPSASVDTPPASTLPPPSGRPPVVFEKADKVSGSFGATPAAKLVTTAEKAVFRIPEYALGDSYLITFMLDKKAAKKAKGGVGSVYRIQAQVPPAEDFSTVVSRGPKFQVHLPAGKVASPNLAIGETKKDDKGKESIEWKVIAPLKIEDGLAVFEIEGFANSMLQITSEAPQ